MAFVEFEELEDDEDPLVEFTSVHAHLLPARNRTSNERADSSGPSHGSAEQFWGSGVRCRRS